MLQIVPEFASMLPPALLPQPSSSSSPNFIPLQIQQRTPTSAGFNSTSTAMTTPSPPHRLAHNISSPHLGSLSPRLGHPGVSRRPRANTEHSVRSRYHHHNPYGARRFYDYGHNESTVGSGGYNSITTGYPNQNNSNNSGNWIPDHSAIISTSSSPSLLPDINMLEDRKPSIGLNGSPHPPTTTLLPGPPPPASPSLSSRSRDSPLYHLSSGEYSTHSSSANSVNYSPESGANTQLPTTVPSSSADDYTFYQQTYPNPNINLNFSMASSSLPSHPTSVQEYEEIISNLRNQLRETEFLRRQDQQRLSELQTGQEIEQQMTRDVDAQFKAAWKSRTEARIKTLCALNRAGNALCAWYVHSTKIASHSNQV